MLTAKLKRNITRIIPYGIIWLLFSIVYTILEKGILGNLEHYPATGNPYNFTNTIFITPLAALTAGLLIGSIEVLFINKLLQQARFRKKILIKSVIYLAITALFIIMLSAVTNYLEFGGGFFSKKNWDYVWAFLFTYTFLSVVLYVTSIIVVSQFYAEIRETVGLSVIQKFFSGKYNKPIEEERIFMFLDMKSSTMIAEEIGHIRYFNMLKEYYADLSAPIIDYYGEVYQYAGDGLIVTWTLKNGLHSNNFIRCFFAMKKSLLTQANKYKSKFNFFPEFKAGFHFGKVTTGEIGVLKKEIVFSGDVLNTTARIQGLCNFYNVDHIISNELISRLDPLPEFVVIPLGENELKGRHERISLATLQSIE